MDSRKGGWKRLIIQGACCVLMLTTDSIFGLGAYVTSEFGNVVYIIDTSTNTVVGTISSAAFNQPQEIVVAPDQLTAYVTNINGNTVTVIDLQTSQIITNIDTAVPFDVINPQGIAITPDGSRVWVSSDSNTELAFAIDTTTNSGISDAVTGIDSHGVAITPDGLLVYIANEDSQTVSKVDMTFFTQFNVPLAAGSNPYGVAITPDNASVYVSNAGATANNVNVISVAFNSVTATIPIGHAARQIKITPDGSHAYVANLTDGTVSVIAIPGNTVVATIPVGTHPLGVGITPDGQFVYVTNAVSNNVSVISTTSDTVIATIPNLNTPFAVAFGVLPPPPPPPPVLLAPQHLRAHVKKNDFAVVYELFVELEWKPHHTSGVKVDGYLIYRGDDLIAKVDAHTFKYKDHDRKKDREYKYSVVAFDTEGNRSAPATIEVKVEVE